MNPSSAPDSIEVAVAVIRRADDRILLCRRPDGARYGGRWEFPGGKVETGESHVEALQRELLEELAIEFGSAVLIHSAETEYGDGGRFAVRFYEVREWRGDPRNLAASELAWVQPADLDGYDLLEGSRGVLGVLRSFDTTEDSTSTPSSSRT